MERRKSRIKAAVYMILVRYRQEDGGMEILLQRRQNTGYMDGLFDFSASGHLEEDEAFKMAAIRESQEELGIKIAEDEVDFVFLADGNEDGYEKVFFMTSAWEGKEQIMEPEKCAELCWFGLDELPLDEMIPDLVEIFRMIRDGEHYHYGAF